MEIGEKEKNGKRPNKFHFEASIGLINNKVAV